MKPKIESRTFILLFFALVAAPMQAQVVIDFTDSNGYGLEADRVMLENIRVEQEIANLFDPSRPDIVTSVYNIPWVFDYNTISLVPGFSITTP